MVSGGVECGGQRENNEMKGHGRFATGLVFYCDQDEIPLSYTTERFGAVRGFIS